MVDTSVVIRTAEDAKGVRVAWSAGGTTLSESPAISQRANTYERTARVLLLGLPAGEVIHYAPYIGGQVIRDQINTFRTMPEGPSSFSFLFASCGEARSIHPVYGEIARLGGVSREKLLEVFDASKLYGDESDYGPQNNALFFLHGGDFTYDDPVSGVSKSVFHASMDSQFLTPEQAVMYSGMSFIQVGDDHDLGSGPVSAGGRLSTNVRNYIDVWGRRMPIPPVEGLSRKGLHFSFTAGRLRIIVWDCTSTHDPLDSLTPSSTMLGATQLAWTKAEILAAKAAGHAVFIYSPKPWIGNTGGDGWGSFPNEREEISQFISDSGMGDSVCMANGDMHSMVYDDGTNSDYSSDGGAAIPVIVAATIDRRSYSVKGGPWSGGTPSERNGQFGEAVITDTGGATIGVAFNGRNSAGATLFTHSFDLTTGES